MNRMSFSLTVPLLFLVAAFLLTGCGSATSGSTDRAGTYTLRGSTDYTGASITIEAAGAGAYHVSGDATWAADEEAAGRGAINVGQLDFTAPLRGDSIAFDSEPFGDDGEFYRLVIRFVEGGLEVVESYPNGFIGYHGFNVSFDGIYEKE